MGFILLDDDDTTLAPNFVFDTMSTSDDGDDGAILVEVLLLPGGEPSLSRAVRRGAREVVNPLLDRDRRATRQNIAIVKVE
eukprot:CAMPEP_0196231718 /NCGR_PEP_ID=MMETSP0913-20130531/2428_1 /TAXON_ID=49265 /ORGANISM="Thalassiosira rotula, Strain GSO102" /LENGTH=80 /DNA_ID=CAMNT_0041511949 /DNA_START=424 /DNA_END=663 /DNA_ORIENTATION=-